MSTAAAPLELQGAYVPPQRITIASIYPIECVTHIARRAPKQSFPVPAGTKEKPGLLVVEDTWESGGTLDKPVNHRILAQHTAKHIVDDLTVYLFEAHAASRSYPGIFICAGDYPTPEEIADAEGCQHRYYQRLIQQARKLAFDKRPQDIQDKHRMAARAEGVTGEDWMQEISKDSKKKCSWCSEFIDQTARRCPKCSGFQTAEDAAAWEKMSGKPAAPAIPVPPVQQHAKG